VTRPGSRVLEKVTAFVTRGGLSGEELLLLEHPFAGVQIPAGTVEEGEAPEDAACREAAEETGLSRIALLAGLGSEDWHLPEPLRMITTRTPVYARPDPISFDWATLPRGAMVHVERAAAGFTQVTFQEWDRWPDRSYLSMRITGWVPDEALAAIRRRHFFHLRHRGDTPPRWQVQIDNHRFTLFWAPLTRLPRPVSPQDGWLRFLRPCGQRFEKLVLTIGREPEALACPECNSEDVRRLISRVAVSVGQSEATSDSAEAPAARPPVFGRKELNEALKDRGY
jgi:8-oxo-dGTP pyrophosphatase MutT (NUDIX family)